MACRKQDDMLPPSWQDKYLHNKDISYSKGCWTVPINGNPSCTKWCQWKKIFIIKISCRGAGKKTENVVNTGSLERSFRGQTSAKKGGDWYWRPIYGCTSDAVDRGVEIHRVPEYHLRCKTIWGEKVFTYSRTGSNLVGSKLPGLVRWALNYVGNEKGDFL